MFVGSLPFPHFLSGLRHIGQHLPVTLVSEDAHRLGCLAARLWASAFKPSLPHCSIEQFYELSHTIPLLK